MEILPDMLKSWGPLAVGWIVAAYLLKFILDRYNADIEARVKLAGALDKLSATIESCGLRRDR